MADDEEQKEKDRQRELAKQEHDVTLGKLRSLRSALSERVDTIINDNYSYPEDLRYEEESRGRIKGSLANVQRRIDETINSL